MKVKHIALLTTLVLGLSACSSSKVVRVPTPLQTLDSPVSLEHNWKVRLHQMPVFDGEGLSIAQSDNRVFVADQQGLVSAILKSNQSRWTDQVVWQTKLSEKVISGPVLIGESLLVGTGKGKVVAFDADTGSVLWESQLSSEVQTKVVAGNGKLFTRTVDGRLYALSPKTGKVIWTVQRPIPGLSLRGASTPLFHEGLLYVGWETGRVEAFKADSGKSLWESNIAVPRGRTELERLVDIQSSLVVKNGRLVALAYHGKLVAMSLETGTLYFTQDVSGFRDVVVDDNAIYAIDEDDVIHAFDVSNGTKLWVQEGLKYRNLADMKVFENQLLVADGQGYMHWLNPLQGTLEGRAKHSNDYGDENVVLQWLIDGQQLYLLNQQGSVNSFTVKPSNLIQFKQAFAKSEKK